MARDDTDLALWIQLSLIPGLGNERYRRLLREFGLPANIYGAGHGALLRIVPEAVAAAINRGPFAGAADTTLNWLQDPINHLVTLADEDYPKALLNIPDPPPLLYIKGRRHLLAQASIAVVGSRNATPQGIKDAEAFARSLSEQSYCIVSGLALGVDTAAHRGGLAGQGSSIAIVGTGLDIVYPARNRELAHQLAANGALVSEYPLGTAAIAGNFPRRNRIISGLSQGCLVVEAALQSGSLITARLAAEQGKEVFAIPGSIHSPLSKGCHQLIKQGAKLVESAQDILEELGAPARPQANAENAIPAEKTDEATSPLLEALGFEPVDMDTLVTRSGLTVDIVSAMLLTLELEGRVAPLPGGRYQRIS